MNTRVLHLLVMSAASALCAGSGTARAAVISFSVRNLDGVPLADDPTFAATPVTVTVVDVSGGQEVQIAGPRAVDTRGDSVDVPAAATAVKLVFQGQGLRTATMDGLLNLAQTLTVAMPADQVMYPPACLCPPYYFGRPCPAFAQSPPLRRFFRR